MRSAGCDGPQVSGLLNRLLDVAVGASERENVGSRFPILRQYSFRKNKLNNLNRKSNLKVDFYSPFVVVGDFERTIQFRSLNGFCHHVELPNGTKLKTSYHFRHNQPIELFVCQRVTEREQQVDYCDAILIFKSDYELVKSLVGSENLDFLFANFTSDFFPICAEIPQVHRIGQIRRRKKRALMSALAARNEPREWPQAYRHTAVQPSQNHHEGL